MANEWPLLSLNDTGVALIDCDHRTPPASDKGYRHSPFHAIPRAVLRATYQSPALPSLRGIHCVHRGSPSHVVQSFPGNLQPPCI